MHRCLTIIATILTVLSSDYSFAAQTKSVNEAMLGTKLTYKFGDFDVQRQSYFSPNDTEIIWFASFRGIVGAPGAKLSIEWIKPDGTVYKKEDFSPDSDDSRFAFTKLDLKDTDKAVLDIKGDWSLKVYWDEDLVDESKFTVGDVIVVPAYSGPPRIRSLENGSIVYEGPDQTDPSLWKAESSSLDALKTIKRGETSKSIAVLAYPYNLDIVPSSMYGFDRAEYMTKTLRKSGLKMVEPVTHETLAEQYKYLFRYDVDKKQLQINFFAEIGDVSFNLAEFSEDSTKIKNTGELYSAGYFPHDLSGRIADRIVEKLADSDYEVLNLTLARGELQDKSVDEILSLVKQRFNVEQVLFLPTTAYTKWIWKNGSNERVEIGLLLCYAAVLFETGKTEPVFTYTDNVDLGDAVRGIFGGVVDKTIASAKINFHSEDWSEDRKIHPERPIKFYKDGVMDDVFAASEVLRRFQGSTSGGKLFNKMKEAGLITEKTA